MSAKGIRQLAFLTLLAVPLLVWPLPAAGQVSLYTNGILFPDGTFLTSGAGNYAHVVVVAKSGGHFTSVQAALDSITDASHLERYLVYVAPGRYFGQVRMKPWVDVQGAGENITRLIHRGANTFPQATVMGSIHAELRDVRVLTWAEGDMYGLGVYNGPGQSNASLRRVRIRVEDGTYNYGIHNSGSLASMTDVKVEAVRGTYNYGLYNTEGVDPKLSRVDAQAWGGQNSYAIYNRGCIGKLEHVTATAGLASDFASGVHNINARPWMIDVHAHGDGATSSFGVYNYNSRPRLWRVKATASGGVNGYGVFAGTGSAVVVEGSILRGFGTAISRGVHVDAGSTVQLAHSRIDPGAMGWIGQYTCVGAYDADFAALDEHCQ